MGTWTFISGEQGIKDQILSGTKAAWGTRNIIKKFCFIFGEQEKKVRKRAKIMNRYNQAPHLTHFFS